MLRVNVFDAFEAFEAVTGAGEDGRRFEQVGEAAAGRGGLERVVVCEQFRDQGDVVAGDGGCCGQEVEEKREGV